MLKKMKISQWLKDYILIVIGTGLMAVSSVLFFDACGMIPGGFTGASILIKEVTSKWKGGIPLWATNLILNIPLIPIAIHLKGWKFVKRTAIASVIYTVWLGIIPPLVIMAEEDLLLVSVFGGILMGAGVGLVFLARATTGGTDLCGAILQHYMPHISLPNLMQGIDLVVVLLGAAVFGTRMTLYSVIAIYIIAKVSDAIMDGLKFSKLAYIISDHSSEIADEIMKRLDRGVTGLHGRGMYTDRQKEILMCVVAPKEIVVIKEIVHKIDEKAFVIVNDSREVLGEGFVQYHQ